MTTRNRRTATQMLDALGTEKGVLGVLDELVGSAREDAAKPKAAPKAKAAKAATRMTFAPGACHHRSADGAPDCTRKVEMKANLCGTAAKPGHQQAWAKAARERSAAAAPAKAPRSAGSSAKTAGAAKARKPAKNSGGAVRTAKPPVPAMGAGVPVVTRVNVPESYVPAMVQLVVPGDPR